MTKNVQVEHYGQAGASAKCKQCDWQSEEINAAKEASDHVRATEHEVLVIKVFNYLVKSK